MKFTYVVIDMCFYRQTMYYFKKIMNVHVKFTNLCAPLIQFSKSVTTCNGSMMLTNK